MVFVMRNNFLIHIRMKKNTQNCTYYYEGTGDAIGYLDDPVYDFL